MAHSPALGCRKPGDVGHNFLVHVVAGELGGLGLLGAADLTDEQHDAGVWVLFEGL